MSYSTVGHEFNVNELTIYIKQGFLNRNTHNNKVMYWWNEKGMTRDSQESNPVFSLGAMVQNSLIQCSRKRYGT